MDHQNISLEINPAKMVQTAQTIDVQLTIIGNCLNSIHDDARALKNVWEGESSEAYQAAMDKLEEESPKILGIIKGYVQNLNDIASRFANDEQKHRIRNEALPADIFGV